MEYLKCDAIIIMFTQEPLWHGEALLDTELECDGGGAAGQAHGADAEDVECDLEAELILNGDHFLRDQGDDEAENEASWQRGNDGKLHLLPEEVHEGAHHDAGGHGAEANHYPQGGGPLLWEAELLREGDHHGALPHLDQGLRHRVAQGDQPTVPTSKHIG